MLGTMLLLALATSLAVLVAGGGALPPPAPLAVVRVPDEPGAIVLPDSQPTVQAVAADLDGDGAPELVRLMGGRSGPLYVEAYRETGGSWAPAASRITAVPGAAGLGEAAYARRPARLLLRQVSGRDRVTLVVQPSFSEPEDERECCLLIHDLVLEGEALRIEQVADPSAVADSVHAIDLDGDGTDELLASYFLAPLNDASSLTEARVFRWADSITSRRRRRPGSPSARGARPSSSATAMAFRATRRPSSAAPPSTRSFESVSAPTTRSSPRIPA